MHRGDTIPNRSYNNSTRSPTGCKASIVPRSNTLYQNASAHTIPNGQNYPNWVPSPTECKELPVAGTTSCTKKYSPMECNTIPNCPIQPTGYYPQRKAKNWYQ
eukprot:3940343-Rhodomonas_salina.2